MDASAMIGEALGNYRLVRVIGSGGMGTVYLAEHTRISRQAAIKILHPESSHAQESVDRFFAEARAASIIKHPGIIEILDCDFDERGFAFIVMEYLEGEALSAFLKRVGPLAGDPASLASIGTRIANAMAAAHERSILHRDLKPENVFLAERPGGGPPAVKVLDFGIAKLIDHDLSPSRTRAGTLLGTPVYMSPEQCRGGPLTAASDIYSLGCILFEMASGRPPFVKESIVEVLSAHLIEAPPLLSSLAPDAPEALVALVGEMLSKSAEERPPTMGEVEARLRAIGFGAPGASAEAGLEPQGAAREPPATKTRALAPVALGIAAALALSLAAAAAWRFWRPPAPPTLASGASGAKATSPPAQPIAHAAPTAPSGMAWVPGGSFAMGSSAAALAEARRWCQERGIACRGDLLAREEPVRTVQIDGFFLDKTEVANDEMPAWLEKQRFRIDQARFVQDEKGRLLLDLHPAHSGLEAGASGISARADRARKPVVQVTWLGAQRFCEDQGKRLPTEAEWEFAARGPSGRTFPWGSGDPACEQVVFGRSPQGECPSESGPEDVGAAAGDVTSEGVRDLGGNVAEWVADAFEAPYPSCDPPCANPVVARSSLDASLQRSIRGGDWSQSADACRAAGRSRREQGKAQVNVGFRCAKSLSSAAGGSFTETTKGGN